MYDIIAVKGISKMQSGFTNNSKFPYFELWTLWYLQSDMLNNIQRVVK